MKEKDEYTFEELCDNLPITVSEFCRRAVVTEGTLARLRQGFSARRATAIKLLKTFSKVYGLELSLDNVTGLTLEDKKAIRKQMLERKGIAEKVEKPPVSQSKPVTEKAPTRVYNRKEKDAGLPAGAMLATDFARAHNVKRETFRDHLLLGLGPGTVAGEETSPVLSVKEHVDYSERVKRTRKDGTEEKERYLTSDQQLGALNFWKRHHVDYSECDQAEYHECPCHTMKKKEQ